MGYFVFLAFLLMFACFCYFIFYDMQRDIERHKRYTEEQAEYLKFNEHEVDAAEKKARKLFMATFPKLYRQYRDNGGCKIPSKIFPVIYLVDEDEVDVFLRNGDKLGTICVHPKKGEAPIADEVLQMVSLLTYQEEHVLRKGNWESDPRRKAYGELELIFK